VKVWVQWLERCTTFHFWQPVRLQWSRNFH